MQDHESWVLQAYHIQEYNIIIDNNCIYQMIFDFEVVWYTLSSNPGAFSVLFLECLAARAEGLPIYRRKTKKVRLHGGCMA